MSRQVQPVSQIQQERTNIFVLEHFRRAEKQSGGLLGAEVFANVQEMDDPGEQCPAFSLKFHGQLVITSLIVGGFGTTRRKSE